MISFVNYANKLLPCSVLVKKKVNGARRSVYACIVIPFEYVFSIQWRICQRKKSFELVFRLCLARAPFMYVETLQCECPAV